VTSPGVRWLTDGARNSNGKTADSAGWTVADAVPLATISSLTRTCHLTKKWLDAAGLQKHDAFADPLAERKAWSW
jgi:hypothetical protein